MNHSLDWLWLIIFAYVSLQFAIGAWSARRSLRHLAGAGEGVRCAVAAIGLTIMVALKGLDVLERPAPLWLKASLLATGVVYVATMAWHRIDELRDEWSGTAEVPDAAAYPTVGWKRTAVLATLVALAAGYVMYRWEEPYTGIVAICSGVLAAIAWGHWIWQRVEWRLINRFRTARDTALVSR